MQLRNAILVAALTAVALAGCQTDTRNSYANANAYATQAQCAPGDPRVVVNLQTKTYALETASAPIFTEAEASGVAAGTNGWPTNSNTATFTVDETSNVAVGTRGWPWFTGRTIAGMKPMCRSEAQRIGAHSF
jgi:hypothetical protein